MKERGCIKLAIDTYRFSQKQDLIGQVKQFLYTTSIFLRGIYNLKFDQ